MMKTHRHSNRNRKCVVVDENGCVDVDVDVPRLKRVEKHRALHRHYRHNAYAINHSYRSVLSAAGGGGVGSLSYWL